LRHVGLFEGIAAEGPPVCFTSARRSPDFAIAARISMLAARNLYNLPTFSPPITSMSRGPRASKFTLFSSTL
jgi:hypothetical protein